MLAAGMDVIVESIGRGSRPSCGHRLRGAGGGEPGGWSTAPSAASARRAHSRRSRRTTRWSWPRRASSATSRDGSGTVGDPCTARRGTGRTSRQCSPCKESWPPSGPVISRGGVSWSRRTSAGVVLPAEPQGAVVAPRRREPADRDELARGRQGGRAQPGPPQGPAGDQSHRDAGAVQGRPVDGPFAHRATLLPGLDQGARIRLDLGGRAVQGCTAPVPG